MDSSEVFNGFACSVQLGLHILAGAKIFMSKNLRAELKTSLDLDDNCAEFISLGIIVPNRNTPTRSELFVSGNINRPMIRLFPAPRNNARGADRVRDIEVKFIAIGCEIADRHQIGR